MYSLAYDSLENPSLPGSSGARSCVFSIIGALGGGVIMINASSMFVDGVISSSGQAGRGAGGGSGGSIQIHTSSLSGSGSIVANGGNGASYTSAYDTSYGLGGLHLYYLFHLF